MLSFLCGTTCRSLGVRAVEMSWHPFFRFLLAGMEYLFMKSISSHSRMLSFCIIHHKNSITLNFNMQVPCIFLTVIDSKWKNKQQTKQIKSWAFKWSWLAKSISLRPCATLILQSLQKNRWFHCLLENLVCTGQLLSPSWQYKAGIGFWYSDIVLPHYQTL